MDEISTPAQLVKMAYDNIRYVGLLFAVGFLARVAEAIIWRRSVSDLIRVVADYSAIVLLMLGVLMPSSFMLVAGVGFIALSLAIRHRLIF